MYMEGVLPSGEVMTATVAGDIRLTGTHVICGACHRRSGMGSSEGQDVVPAVTGPLLYSPLRLPTSRPPLAPELRPAYTDASLRRAIRDGVGPAGKEFSLLMPRYPLTDEELDILIGYLKTLSASPASGVTDREMHFATIVADSVDPGTRKALLDVLEAYFAQKNTETRYESKRAAGAPWHKEWVFGPYRKWVLHVWELKGPRASWPEQLEVQYRQQPVFAVLSGIAPGSWQPIHDFCEEFQVPCLFPMTDLPVIDEQDFYSVYLSKGVTQEAGTVVRHLSHDGLLSNPVVQVFREGDPKGEGAAEAVGRLLSGREVVLTNVPLGDAPRAADVPWRSVLAESKGGVVILWLGESDLAGLWKGLDAGNGPARVYLSTTLYDGEPDSVPVAARDRVYFVHPYELPGKLPRLLMRSTGWFKAKRIYSPEEQRVQADAFLALKTAGEAVRGIRGYFNREYFLERIEHMVDNAAYTSVYPRISLAPGQRFVSKGSYIAKLPKEGDGGLVGVSDWLIPGSH